MVVSSSCHGTAYIPPPDYIHLSTLGSVADWAPFVIAGMLLIMMHRRLAGRRAVAVTVGNTSRGPWESAR
jgi:hypothetical protein